MVIHYMPDGVGLNSRIAITSFGDQIATRTHSGSRIAGLQLINLRITATHTRDSSPAYSRITRVIPSEILPEEKRSVRTQRLLLRNHWIRKQYHKNYNPEKFHFNTSSLRCKDTAFFSYTQEKREKSPNLSDFSLMV